MGNTFCHSYHDDQYSILTCRVTRWTAIKREAAVRILMTEPSYPPGSRHIAVLNGETSYPPGSRHIEVLNGETSYPPGSRHIEVLNGETSYPPGSRHIEVLNVRPAIRQGRDTLRC